MTGHIDARGEWEGEKLEQGYRRTRRYRATQQFLDLAHDFGVTPTTIKDHSEASHRHATLIELRTKKGQAYGRRSKGKRVRLKGPKFEACREQIERLNAFMKTHEYSLIEPPMVRRLFNCADRPGFDFDLGGRFYCASADGWIEKTKEERRQILIDGQPTVEVDVRASHLSILYALCGKQLDAFQDPYAIGNYPRDIVKKLIVSAIGRGGMPKRWPQGFNEKYQKDHGWQPRDHYKLKDVVSMIVARHPVLERLQKDDLDWANLQFEESECFLSAMLELHEARGVPSLPVHDSLIVRGQDTAVAAEALCKAYEARLGIRPVITIPQVALEGLDAWVWPR